MKKYIKPQIKTIMINHIELLSGSNEAKSFDLNNNEETDNTLINDDIWDE